MINAKDEFRLRHMLDAARSAMHHSRSRKREDLNNNELFSLAMVRLLEIIGEAARGVSQNTRQALPEIPWSQITGTRDHLAHGYFDVDFDIIWAIIKNDLPDLIDKLEKIALI